METDKALVEVTSPRAGTIASLHGQPGEIIKVGAAFVEYSGSGVASPAPSHKEPTPTAKPPSVPEPKPHAEEREDEGTVVGMMNAGEKKALATPAVRRLARDLNVDIDAVRGSGIGGRILEKDVQAVAGGASPAPRASSPARAQVSTPSPAPRAAAPAPAPRTAPSIPTAEEITRIPFRGIRRTIANRLRESVSQTVHFTVMDEAEVSALDSLRRKLAGASGEKVSFLPFVASAITRVLGMPEFKGLNANTNDAANNGEGEVIQFRSVHLGIAADTDNGLMVPVIRDADRLGVLELSRSITMVAESARNRSIPRDQLVGSTFTISNVGSHAGRFATPIINYPEVGILAVGRAREGVVVNKGAFRVGLLLPLSLACDHRVVDGAMAALALAKIIDLLQSPEQLLTPARG
jgi:pyruvate dehydrogenase E2 component (dihydrolipoamide acetyltransferase)